MPLQSIDNIHGSDGLSLGMFSVCDSVTDDVLKEHLQNSASLLIDETRDALNSATAGKTADGWLGDSLDVITQDFPVALGASLSKTLSSFSSSRHVALVSFSEIRPRMIPLQFPAGLLRPGLPLFYPTPSPYTSILALKNMG